ncbi:hypothetical protein P261_01589 [Lachnospiraceae bacterium TWA4]|nr:hypothetical protein P261_01589 [Lachnospiraceae bacterium TWA4]
MQENRKKSTNRQMSRSEIRRRRKRRAYIRYYLRLLTFLAVCIIALVVVSKGVIKIIDSFSSETIDFEEDKVELEAKIENLNDLLDTKKQEDLLNKILENESDYPSNLVKLAKNKPETRQFVYDYLEKSKEVVGQASQISVISDCENVRIPYFRQWDERWGYYLYGDDFLALTGCGPTCLSMVYVGLTKDTSENPYTISAFSEKQGYFVSNSGTSWELMSEGAEALGLESKTVSLDEEIINNTLDEGRIIIASMGPGDFTSKGHFIVIVGYTDKGYEIRDPDSITRTNKFWTFDKIKGQIKNLWAFSS